MDRIQIEIDHFLLYCESRNLKRKTLVSYEQALRMFADYLRREFDIRTASAIRPNHVRSYVKHLRERGTYSLSPEMKRRGDANKPLSDTTIGNYVRYIKIFLKFLYEEGEIQTDITKRIENIKPKRKQRRLLSEQELKQFFDGFDTFTFWGRRDWTICRLLLDTGMRIGECLALKPEDIDLRNRTIIVRNTKNGHERAVYFSDKMARELRRWLQYKERYLDSPYMFPTIRGTQLKVNNFERSLREVGKRTGIKVQPHLFRSLFAKYYLLNGGDWFTLSRILGHSSVKVTQEAYLDFTNEEVGRKYIRHSPLSTLDV